MKKLFSKVKASKGFTLVEMIVVMAIIGILVALLAPNVATLIRDAQNTANDAKVKNAMTSLAAYNTKMIKDGYSFVPDPDQDFDAAVSGDDAYIETVTGSAEFDTKVRALWKKGTITTSPVTFVGKASGYLPENVLNADETMYIYLTKDGNVLGITYTDKNDIVMASNTNLEYNTTGFTLPGTITAGLINSSSVRDTETTDGLKFELN